MPALLLMLLGPGAGAEIRTDCLDRVCLHMGQGTDRVVIEASNRNSAPVGVEVRFQGLQNLVATPRRTKEFVVVPGGERKLIYVLVRQDASLGASYPFRWRWVYGDPYARHDPSARYQMPFGGKEERILTQGIDGAFSHTGESRYSFDWAMPIGTPIIAARSGRVVNVADGYTRAGTAQSLLREANAVTIMHDDGTFATYAHLDPGSGVRIGMEILAGEVIGFSGNTGFSTGPHLHFSVWQSTPDGRTGTIPILFRTPRHQGIVPEEQVAYQPSCHTGGVPCAAGQGPPMPAKRRVYVEKDGDGICRCKNGAQITTHLPCRMVCP